MEDLKKDLGLAVLVFFLICFILWIIGVVKILSYLVIWD